MKLRYLLEYNQWEASTDNDEFDASGQTPLDAVAALVEVLENESSS